MSAWRCSPTLTPDQRLEVLDLLNRTEIAIGREAIDEGRRRTVIHAGPGEHWLHVVNQRVRGYALLYAGEPASIEMCGGGTDEGLAQAVLARHGVVDWWIREARHEGRGRVVRTLQLLRVALPIPTTPAFASGFLTREFDPQRDIGHWLEQNNAAFADHPEQGAWSERELRERIAEPWFDPTGFIVLDAGDRLAASCWTKVHELHPDRFGEIYVISVHPDFRGRGLGRRMVTEGLDLIRRRGVASAVLFVDESNRAAQRLYQSIGFALEREDRLVRFGPD